MWIKNSKQENFQVHEIPAPYIWDESFMTFYKRIDDEHKVGCMNTLRVTYIHTASFSAWYKLSGLFEKCSLSGAV